MVDYKKLAEGLNDKFDGHLELAEGVNAIFSKREDLVLLFETLKGKYGFNRLADIAAVDYEEGYEVVYHLLNESAELLCVKVKLDKSDCTIPSISSIWKAADPQEREAYDLMGIIFEGHTNLTRILCPDDFIGHPLRKDFKLDIPDRFQDAPRKGAKFNVIDGR